MTALPKFLLLLLALVQIVVAACSQDSCLRDLTNDPKASRYCASILGQPSSYAQFLPPWWDCGRDVAKISSACSCFLETATSTFEHTTLSTTTLRHPHQMTSRAIATTPTSSYSEASETGNTCTESDSLGSSKCFPEKTASVAHGISSRDGGGYVVTVTTTVTEPSASTVTTTVIASASACAETSSACGLAGIGPLKPKVFIISLFTPEGAVWIEPLNLTVAVTIPGFSPLFPSAFCSPDGDVCQLTTGEGEINAAATIAALVHSPCFDLSTTYFLIGGIAGINPSCGTTGSIALAHYAVQVGLSYEIDARELANNYTSGYIPLGATSPDEYPPFLYGTEVFELSTALRDKAFSIASGVELNDSSDAQAYRSFYPDSPANQPPQVFKGDVVTSDVYWHGELLGEVFTNYTTLLTNSSGTYCMTAQEDTAILEAMVRGAMTNLVDFSRIIVMRAASNFDRPPPGETAAQQLFYTVSGGFPISLANIYVAGRPIVDDILGNWDGVYEGGIEVVNYLGDAFGSIKNQAFGLDIGSVYAQQG